MDCSLPASSVHGILQARKLEWVSIPSSRGSSWARNWTQGSCVAGRFFTIWATREVLCWFLLYNKVILLHTYIHSFSCSFPLWFITGFIFFKDFFWCGPFLKSFIDFVTILLLFFCSLLFWSRGWGMWNLWSLIRDRTWGPGTERPSLTHWTTREVPLSQDTEYTVGPCCSSTLYIGLGKKFIQKFNWLQFSCLENSVDRAAWWAKVHGVTKSRTRLSD